MRGMGALGIISLISSSPFSSFKIGNIRSTSNSMVYEDKDSEKLQLSIVQVFKNQVNYQCCHSMTFIILYSLYGKGRHIF